MNVDLVIEIPNFSENQRIQALELPLNLLDLSSVLNISICSLETYLNCQVKSLLISTLLCLSLYNIVSTLPKDLIPSLYFIFNLDIDGLLSKSCLKIKYLYCIVDLDFRKLKFLEP